MFWTVEKLEQRIRSLAPYRYRDARAIGEMMLTEDPEGEIGARPPGVDISGPLVGRPVQRGAVWSGRDRYLWLSATVQVPRAWQGRKVLGRFDFGQTGGGNNSGFESLLYINGAPWQGVDSNHQEVFLSETAPGEALRLDFRLWSGLGGYQPDAVPEHRLNLAELCWLDEAADDLYFTAWSALETVQQLPEDSADRAALLSLLDGAFLRLDWSRPGSEAFYASVAEARDMLAEGLGRMKRDHPVEVRCIGHTHIDVAWLWRLRHTREKAARSFSTVLRLMEQYPEYLFLQTQPQLYDYIKQDYPDLYARIKERVAEGRWEAGGAMWLEADCNLTSGESLVRQLLYGTRFFRDEFGVECKYLWLPDVFGYSWALPQILKKSGIEMFMTTKISWNQYNRMPHDTFLWRGMDGTEIPAHFITTPEPGRQEGSFFYTYNGMITPFTVQGIWKAYRDKELNRNLLLAYGYGDGGGGVNREMLEIRRRLEDMPGLPKVTTGRADEYFRELKETLDTSSAYVHTWDGELYLELHRGTYTSQAYNKRMNRKLELGYREAEWLGAVSRAVSGSWEGFRQADLAEGWRIILRNQFHDIIPGSSIREVYEDSRVEYAEAEALGQTAWETARESLAEAKGFSGAGPGAPAAGMGAADGVRAEETYTVFNSASFARRELVTVPFIPGGAQETAVFVDEKGHVLPAQRGEAGYAVLAGPVPPMGACRVGRASAGAGAGRAAGLPEAADGHPGAAGFAGAGAAASGRGDMPFSYKNGRLDTPFYLLEWNASGQLTRIYDRSAEREVLAAGAIGNLLQVFEDRPKGRHEAWDIDIFYTEKMTPVTQLETVQLTACGSLYASVRFVYRYMDSRIEQTLVAYSHSRRLDFRTHADWHESRQLLKVAFPVDIRATEATYDIQFGNVKRPTHWNTSWDWARFETVGHQWADLSERDYGVSLLNDCKYGYAIKDNVLQLTLIKSAMVPDATADQGEHVFTYALYPHEGDWYHGGTVQEAWALNSPLLCAAGASRVPDGSLFRTDAPHVFIDAVKKAEDSDHMVVRLHEFAGKRGPVRLGSDWGVLSYQECDLLERPLGEPVEGAELPLTVKPYEIRTFLVRFRDR
ncbi:alpha-mannosidase [Paenibacillus sp. YN15]|uniref:alpha-mannosidase n=1 Tax=Paenibacillus sp. YN15 TaxID=1742774 RepID=UPI000DCEC6E6|nr:alpha-mannosidase [Paenibacillus sp. YN15]RAU91692.1 alpha-mannosidase [Paenibacillus sp. YN15]